ncbi:MAG: co-chaperone GroES [Deltaproteobacteria bacterium]|nr:co-chaperone GroES [Deltaproteobacteria bacterium]
MNVRPLGERVLIRRLDRPTQSAGGLFLPETATEKPQEGRVLSVGAAVGDTLKQGDRVAFGRFAGSKIQVEGEELLILDVGDVLGVIEA